MMMFTPTRREAAASHSMLLALLLPAYAGAAFAPAGTLAPAAARLQTPAAVPLMVGTIAPPPSPPTWTPARVGKAAVFSGLIVAAAATDGPALSLYSRVLASSVACTLPGLLDSHLAVSYGYGMAMVVQAALYASTATAIPSKLLLLAYATYGIKVCIFQALRDARPAYVEKALAEGRKKSPRGLSVRRAPLVLSVGALLSCFCFPLHAAARAPAARGVALGALAALGGLLVQCVADAQKFAVKRSYGPNALCNTGLWAFSRHPNYLGEIYFQCGLLLGGLCAAAAARSAGAALLAGVAPLLFISIMLGATTRLEARQLKAYGDAPAYRASAGEQWPPPCLTTPAPTCPPAGSTGSH